jgi:sulfur dioxygenase
MKQIIQLFEPESSTFTYILNDKETREAIIIDPVDSMIQRDLAVLKDNQLCLRYVIETHTHADHITSAAALVELTGAIAATPVDCGSHAALLLKHGDVLNVGSLKLNVLHTPGHTAGSMCFYIVINEEHHIFTGDTLLVGGCGRTDFQSGSSIELYRSVTEQLFQMPDSTIVWPGHDYRGNTQSTIAIERESNPRFINTEFEPPQRRTQIEFIEIMDALNLPLPKRIHEAVPANLNLGLSEKMTNHRLSVKDAQGYAGDITPELAWQWMQSGEAVMVDIRTEAERAWVGFVPGVAGVMYKVWPGMALNPDYDKQLQAVASKDKKLMLLCRSGLRSVPAAKRAAELGFQAYNILEGFEGDPDDQAHRNNIGGWRHLGLPWRQN